MSWLYCHNLQCMDCPRKIGCPHARFWSIFYCYLPLRVTAPRHHFLWDRGGGTKPRMGLDLNCVLSQLSGDRWRGHGGPRYDRLTAVSSTHYCWAPSYQPRAILGGSFPFPCLVYIPITLKLGQILWSFEPSYTFFWQGTSWSLLWQANLFSS